MEETDVEAGVVEYAVYGGPGELPELPDLRAAAGGALVEISTSELPDDWGERWKRFHRPVLIEAPLSGAARRASDGLVRGWRRIAVFRQGCRVAGALHVRPPWEPPSDRAAT